MLTMNVFLTGNIRVGKSTIIRSILAKTGVSADGFVTYWEPEGGGRSLYLSPYISEQETAARYLIAHDDGSRFAKTENISDVFDVHGAEILNRSGNRDIILMDELGVLESEAASFHESVLRRLSGGIPVLGVIKSARTGFLDAVRSHRNVEIYEVTRENSENVLAVLFTIFGR